MLLQKPKLVDAFNQTTARKNIDRIIDRPAIRQRKRRRDDIDLEFDARVIVQPLMDICIDDHYDETVFERVITKYVCNLR